MWSLKVFSTPTPSNDTATTIEVYAQGNLVFRDGPLAWVGNMQGLIFQNSKTRFQFNSWDYSFGILTQSNKDIPEVFSCRSIL